MRRLETGAVQRDAGGCLIAFAFQGLFNTMDISRDEQRVLHALAQGGAIHPLKDERGRITAVELYNRNGWLMACPLNLFRKLRRKGAVASRDSGPYRITRRGLELVRSEVDNR